MEYPCQELSSGRAYHLLCSLVAPRPIAWVTTESGGIVNAAPFSWFQAVCADPPMVMVAIVDKDGGLKDTARNALASKEFVVNIAAGDQLQALVDSSAPFEPTVSEVDALGIATEPSKTAQAPRIAGAAGYLECKLVEHHRYGRENATTVLVGEVMHMAVRDDLANERGNLDTVKAGLAARLGGPDYLQVQEVFSMTRQEGT